MKAVSSSRLIRYAVLASVVGSICPDYAFAGCEGLGSFAAHKDNYVLLANQMKNNGWADRDDTAIRLQYSTKYSFKGCPAKYPDAVLLDESIEVFTSYTGMFDFYLRSRESDPVINRTSNLGIIHIRFPGKLVHLDSTSLEVSLEHRSTGQVFEPTTNAGTVVARQNYDRGNSDARQFFDTLSRGSNYIGIKGYWKKIIFNQDIYLRLNYNIYLSQNSKITWGPLKDSGRTIKNYDLINLAANIPTKIGDWGMEWKIGGSGLKTDSIDLTWKAPEKILWNIPFYARLHIGEMNTLSNYTQRQDSIGIGLKFSEFK